MTDHLRGHKIEKVNGEWVYSDTKKPTKENWEDRPCGECDLPFTDDGHDGCIGTLDNVKNACCGHGQPTESYVQFEDGKELRGFAANTYLSAFKKTQH